MKAHLLTSSLVNFGNLGVVTAAATKPETPSRIGRFYKQKASPLVRMSGVHSSKLRAADVIILNNSHCRP